MVWTLNWWQIWQDEEWDIDCDPFDIVTCMRGSDLPLLLDACPTLQRLTLNSVLPRWCAELHPFLHDAQVRRTWCLWCLGGVSESVGGCECRGGGRETNPNVSCKKNVSCGKWQRVSAFIGQH